MSASTPPDIQRVLDAISPVVPRFPGASLRAYLEELLRWNPQLSLVSKRETPRVVAALVDQCVTLWDLVRQDVAETVGLRVADIGSGGGFPGVIWKLLAPEITMTLIERKSRKAFFLERVTARLGLDGVEVFEGDVAAVADDPSRRGQFGLAVMMAVAPPEQMAGAVDALLQPGGFFCTVRASDEKVIADHLGCGLTVQQCLQANDRIYITYRKISEHP